MARNRYTDPAVFVAIILISIVTYGVITFHEYRGKIQREDTAKDVTTIVQSTE